MNKYKTLFESIEIGGIELKNRIVMVPYQTKLANVNGEVTDRMLSFYRERAKGGVSMVIVEATAISSNNFACPCQLRIDNDSYGTGLHYLAEAIKDNGAIATIQLQHAGAQCIRSQEPVGPSDMELPFPQGPLKIRGLTVEEIKELVRLFGEAALRAKMAGFDMIEFHGATSYLLAYFFSPRTNKRDDEYGGSIEKRMRFPIECVREVKRVCGEKFPIGYRLHGDEWLPGGITIDQAIEFAKALEKEGVSYISVTAGAYESFPQLFSIRSKKGFATGYGKEIKKAVNIPVIVAGRLGDPNMMVDVLENEMADIIGLARPLLADPEIPKKLYEGRAEDIRLCIGCNECMGVYLKNWAATCAQNPSLGREEEYYIYPIEKKRRVLIIGGGPAGLEAARISALRGHDVTLYEKEGELGGQLILTAIPPGKQEFKTVVLEWLKNQCEKNGVKIELNKEADSDMIEKFNPDVLILATGMTPYIPEVPGIDRNNVFHAYDVLTGEVEVIGKKVVIERGSLVGTETAEFLAEKGYEVTIIEKYPEIAWNMEPLVKYYILGKFHEYGVRVLTQRRITEILEKGVFIEEVNKEGEREFVECDSVVIAWGGDPNNKLFKELKGKIKEIYLIGDCREPRKLMDAIHDGAYIGINI
jgi:2,4-dienoyl-CoA reductase-like NADH-dependent reductase (Old Yellow Enzyme family)/thioredoxin reductase